MLHIRAFLIVTFGMISLISCSKKSTETEGELSSSSIFESSSSQDLSSSSEGASSSDIPLSSSLWAVPIYTAQDSLVLIDDFEDAEDPNLGMSTAMGGWWYTFADNGGGGESSIEPLYGANFPAFTGSGYESNGLLAAQYRLDKGTYEWAPYVVIGASIQGNEVFDASGFAGFEYWYRGAAHRIRVEVLGVRDYDFHYAQQTASPTVWKKVVVDFSTITQEGWGAPVVFTANEIDRLNWEIRGNTGDSGTFELDDIRFLESITYEIKNDMVIRDPIIPALTTVEDLSVDTDLNRRSMRYLSKGLNFTNWLEQEKFTGNNWTFDESDVIRHANQGFLGLRLPIDLDLYVIGRDSVIAGTKAFAMDSLIWVVLDSFDVWTSRHNMSYTIDYHQYDGSFTGTSAVNPGYRAMAANAWKSVAAHFKNTVREDLFFELTNEPDLGAGTDKITATEWRALAQQMIDSIRTEHATIPIIYGATDFYSIDKLLLEDVFSDPYIIYAFHFYDPFIFTHQGASWADMGTTRDVPFPYTAEEWSTEFRDFGVMDATPSWIKSAYRNYYQQGNKNYLKNRIIRIKEWAHERQVPLICNEWGAYQRNAQIEHTNNYNRTMGEIFEELDIAWQVWFGVFDNQGNLLPGLQESLGLVAP
jgi:licheninase